MSVTYFEFDPSGHIVFSQVIGFHAHQMFLHWRPRGSNTTLIKFFGLYYPTEFIEDMQLYFGTLSQIGFHPINRAYMSIKDWCSCYKRRPTYWCGFCKPTQLRCVFVCLSPSSCNTTQSPMPGPLPAALRDASCILASHYPWPPKPPSEPPPAQQCGETAA